MAKTQETLNQSAKQPAEPPTVEYSAPEFDHQSATERPKYSVSISRNVLVVAAVIVGLGLSFIAGAQFQKHNGFDDEGAVRTSAMGQTVRMVWVVGTVLAEWGVRVR